MTRFDGEALSWRTADRIVEVALHREPANEIGTAMLADLERLAAALPALEAEASALVLYGALPSGFSAGADLRELHGAIRGLSPETRTAEVRVFLRRIHAAFDALDATSLTTIAAVHGLAFGGGWELALTCDLVVADRMARFAFPELRLGLVPGFGGIARLEREVGSAVVRDLLLTGRSLNAARARAGTRQPARRGGTRPGGRPRDGGAGDEAGPPRGGGGEADREAHPARGAGSRHRGLLRAVRAARGGGGARSLRAESRRDALSSLTVAACRRRDP